MSLPTPNLDDLTFQELVDHAKRLIPQYCPEWTDHNVSDPGVTLIELFASMCEMLLYRVNQVPDKMFRTFLNLLGTHLTPPYPAYVPVTCYLAAPMAPTAPALTIPAGTEVSTVRTETIPPIIFSTRTDLLLTPAALQGFQTRTAPLDQPGDWQRPDLSRDRFAQQIALFAPKPQPHNAFYLYFKDSISGFVIDLHMTCAPNQGSGINEQIPPPQVWEIASGSPAKWRICELERDTTVGFNRTGVIRLRLPQAEPATIDAKKGFWLRCVLTDKQTGLADTYSQTPKIEGLTVQTVGGTVTAEHAINVRGEQLGESNGAAGQVFQLRNSPVLSLNPEHDYLIVQTRDGREYWKEVRDFGDSKPDDRHYVIDRRTGTLTLGPTIPLPEGGIYRFGAVPPTGSKISINHYQYGGGRTGNVARGALTLLRTSIPSVSRVTNWYDGLEGRDGQSIEEALLRVPQLLRTRDRAVAADDFVHLALAASPKVGRAHCLAPGLWPPPEAAPDAVDERDRMPRPGEVTVLIMPYVDEPARYLKPELLIPSEALIAEVQANLNRRIVLGASVRVQAPTYVAVTVQAAIRAIGVGGTGLRAAIREQAEAELYRLLNPFVGGSDTNGWPFGRTLYVAEIAGLLQRIAGVDQVKEVILIADNGEPTDRVVLANPRQVICSNLHSIVVL